MRVKLCKCQFAATEVSFLGHRVSQDGVSEDPEKVAAIRNISRPTCVKDVRSFLGLAGYYRRFIKDFATLAAPLTKLTTKQMSSRPFAWTAACDNSFTQLKQQLCAAPILAYPQFDRMFTLYTDASDVGLGAVLAQNDDTGVERVVAYASRALSERERRYATTEKEALAIHYATEHFRLYLLGRRFKIVTDHSALKWLSSIEPKGRLGRWIMDLQEFQFFVEYRAGKIHQNADALSRLVQREAAGGLFNLSCAVSASIQKFHTFQKGVCQILRAAALRFLLVICHLFELFPRRGANVKSVVRAEDIVLSQAPTQEMHEIPLGDNSVRSCLISLNQTINLKDAQRQDKALMVAIDYIEQGKPKPDFNEWKSNPTLRNLWHNYNRLFVRNELLVRSRTVRSPHPDYALVIPPSLVPEILKGVHDSPFCGHLGVTRTETRIRQRFYWPGIRNSVVNYIKHCTVCQKRKSPTTLSKAPLQTIDVGEPFSFWALDYMGPIAETSRGNKYILVVTDHFTKWCEAFPTKDQKASTVAQTLISKVFSRFRPPTILRSDQGANFESNLMHEICDIMGIAKTRTTAYHPQGDGQAERHNRTVQDMLAAFVSAQRDDWDLWLDPIVYAYNTSRQESTGLSPYELVFGKLPRLPLECELGVPLSNPATHAEYTRKTRSILQQAQNIAQENLRLAHSKRCQADRQTEWQSGSLCG